MNLVSHSLTHSHRLRLLPRLRNPGFTNLLVNVDSRGGGGWHKVCNECVKRKSEENVDQNKSGAN